MSASEIFLHRRVRDYFLLAFTIVFTVTCVALGFWQLRRLAWRKGLNAEVIARLGKPAVPIAQLPRDTAKLHYLRVALAGSYDYSHEVRVVDRTFNGSPGVDIVTPVRMAGNDTALLVTRGWVYSPDGVTVDLSKWREPDSVSAIGYARPLAAPMHGRPTLEGHPGAYRWLDLASLRSSMPYPVYPFTVVLEGDSTVRAGIPPRVPPPPLDEGPHLSYAIQWFSFALIAVGGTAIFLMAEQQNKRRAQEQRAGL